MKTNQKAGQASSAEVQALREKVLRLVEETPKKAVMVLTDWLQQPAPRNRIKKKIA